MVLFFVVVCGGGDIVVVDVVVLKAPSGRFPLQQGSVDMTNAVNHTATQLNLGKSDPSIGDAMWG